MGRQPFLILEGSPVMRADAAAHLKQLGFVNPFPVSEIGEFPNVSWKLEDYEGWFFRALEIAERQPVFIDKFWLSVDLWMELIKTSGGSLAGRVLERLAMRYAVQRVLLVPSFDLTTDSLYPLVTALAGRPENPDLIPLERTGHLSYIAHLLVHQLNQVQGWSMVSTPEDLELAIRVNRVERSNRPSWVWDFNWTSWYGSLDPRLIIVGDQFNPFDAPHPYPFAKDSHSAYYLNYAINLAGIQEQQLAWVNVNDAKGPSAIVKLFSRYTQSERPLVVPPPTIVALGKQAHLTLNRMGYAHVELPHPQFVKRFHHDGLYDYAHQFGQLLGITETYDER